MAWMGRGCGGGALEPCRGMKVCKTKRQKILPVDKVLYIVGRTDQIRGMNPQGGTKKTMPVDRPLLTIPGLIFLCIQPGGTN